LWCSDSFAHCAASYPSPWALSLIAASSFLSPVGGLGFLRFDENEVFFVRCPCLLFLQLRLILSSPFFFCLFNHHGYHAPDCPFLIRLSPVRTLSQNRVNHFLRLRSRPPANFFYLCISGPTISVQSLEYPGSPVVFPSSWFPSFDR